MEKKLFETIYNNLQSRVEWCDNNLGNILCKNDLENLTLKQYQSLLKGCKNLMSDMDKIYTEINHIYGMGNLTVQQQSRLISIMRRFTNYRSDIKCLATHNDVNTIPNIPTKSTYQLSVLANAKLVRNIRGNDEEDEEDKLKEEVTEVSEMNDVVKQTIITAINNKLPYNIVREENDVNVLEVRFDVDDVSTVDQVNKEIATLFDEKRPKRKNFLKQVCKLGEHYKFNWDVEGCGKMVGRVQITNKIWPRVKQLAGIH